MQVYINSNSLFPLLRSFIKEITRKFDIPLSREWYKKRHVFVTCSKNTQPHRQKKTKGESILSTTLRSFRAKGQLL